MKLLEFVEDFAVALIGAPILIWSLLSFSLWPIGIFIVLLFVYEFIKGKYKQRNDIDE